MQRVEVSCAVQPIYGSLGVKRLIIFSSCHCQPTEEMSKSGTFCIRHNDVAVLSHTGKLVFFLFGAFALEWCPN